VCLHLWRNEGVGSYQTDTFAEGIVKGTKHVEGRNEPCFQPVIAFGAKLIGLKLGENGGRRIAFFELFEEILALQIFLSFFLVGLESSIKDAFDVGRGCGRSLGLRNRSGSLTHVDGMGRVCWTMGREAVDARRKPLID
jgi:hypothetical protein